MRLGSNCSAPDPWFEKRWSKGIEGYRARPQLDDRAAGGDASRMKLTQCSDPVQELVSRQRFFLAGKLWQGTGERRDEMLVRSEEKKHCTWILF